MQKAAHIFTGTSNTLIETAMVAVIVAMIETLRMSLGKRVSALSAFCARIL